MRGRRLIFIGSGAIAVGLLVIVTGAIAASTGLFVGLILLLLAPLLVAFFGAVLLLVGLLRTSMSHRASSVRRLIGLAAVAGLAGGFAFGALGTLSQLPDYAAGLNGAYTAGASTIFSTLFLMGVGLVAGVGLGAVMALIRWAANRLEVAGNALLQDPSKRP